MTILAWMKWGVLTFALHWRSRTASSHGDWTQAAWCRAGGDQMEHVEDNGTVGNSEQKYNSAPSSWHIQEEGAPDTAGCQLCHLLPFCFAHKALILPRFQLVMCFQGSLTPWGTPGSI